MSNDTLTEREQRFVDQFLLLGNATQAALAAGYANNRGISAMASRVFNRPRVKAAIEAAKEQMHEKNLITVEGILADLQELKVRCMSDEKWNPQAAKGALELLGKHLKMFTDRMEIDTSDELAEKLARARRRLEEDS